MHYTLDPIINTVLRGPKTIEIPFRFAVKSPVQTPTSKRQFDDGTVVLRATVPSKTDASASRLKFLESMVGAEFRVFSPNNLAGSTDFPTTDQWP